MHLAVKSVDHVESTRPVRFLLIRGARKDIRDNKGRLPSDLIKEVRNKDLAEELTRMLVIFVTPNMIYYRKNKDLFNFLC